MMEYDNDKIKIDAPKPKGRPKGVLNNRREMIAMAYLRTFSVKESAKEVGLSSLGRAYQLLNDPATQYIIQQKLAEYQAEKNEVLIRITDIARGAMRHFILDGQLDLESEDAKKHYHLIKRIKRVTTTKYTRDGEPIVTETTDIETYDSLAALTLLAKFHGILSQRDDDDTPPPNNTLIINNINDAQMAGLDVGRIRARLAELMGGDIQQVSSKGMSNQEDDIQEVDSQSLDTHTVDSHTVNTQ